MGFKAKKNRVSSWRKPPLIIFLERNIFNGCFVSQWLRWFFCFGPNPSFSVIRTPMRFISQEIFTKLKIFTEIYLFYIEHFNDFWNMILPRANKSIIFRLVPSNWFIVWFVSFRQLIVIPFHTTIYVFHEKEMWADNRKI